MSQEQRTKAEKTTDYRQQLHPWCIVQRLPKMQNRIVARFRRRNDADDHRRVLRQLIPAAQYTTVFDSISIQTDRKTCSHNDGAIARISTENKTKWR